MANPTAQWFSPYGKCCGCGKRAHGDLMSYLNDRLGPYCEPCAKRAIKAAHRLGQFAPDFYVKPADPAP